METSVGIISLSRFQLLSTDAFKDFSVGFGTKRIVWDVEWMFDVKVRGRKNLARACMLLQRCEGGGSCARACVSL